MRRPPSIATRNLGLRLRVTYLALLAIVAIPLAFVGVGLHRYLDRAAFQATITEAAARQRELAAQSMQRAWQVTADPSHPPEELDEALARWDAQQDKIAELLRGLCSDEETSCRRFASLATEQKTSRDDAERQLFTSDPRTRGTQLQQLEVLQRAYSTGTDHWLEALATRLTEGASIELRRAIAAIAGVAIATLLVIFLVLEPAVRRLQHERNDLDAMATERAHAWPRRSPSAPTTPSSSPTRVAGSNGSTDGFVRLTGFSLADALGQTPTDLLCGTDTDAQSRFRMRQALRTGAEFRDEMLNYRKDRQPYWALVDGKAVHDAEGVLTGYILLEARRLGAQERRTAGCRHDAPADRGHRGRRSRAVGMDGRRAGDVARPDRTPAARRGG